MFDIRTGTKGPTITLTRGDFCSFHVDILDASGNDYELQEGDVVYFTVKQSTKSEQVLIQKTGVDIEIEPEDTQNLQYGSYVYDVQLTYANGRNDTFIGPADFVITEEVTWRVGG